MPPRRPISTLPGNAASGGSGQSPTLMSALTIGGCVIALIVLWFVLPSQVFNMGMNGLSAIAPSGQPNEADSKPKTRKKNKKAHRDERKDDDDQDGGDDNQDDDDADPELGGDMDDDILPQEDATATPARAGTLWVREEKCRTYLEDRLQCTFPKTRKIVKSPITGRFLELDGYSATLKIAFEHNGIQHYVYPNRFHHSVKEFVRQRTNDRIKAQVCREKGIRLLIVRYDEDVEESLARQLESIGE